MIILKSFSLITLLIRDFVIVQVSFSPNHNHVLFLIPNYIPNTVSTNNCPVTELKKNFFALLFKKQKQQYT